MGSLIKKKNLEDISKYPNSPNFKYKLTITKTNDPCSYTHLFEVYVSHKDNKTYIASKNYNHNIDIFDLLDNKKITSLKGHEGTIDNIRYFINKKNYNEYLISADSFNAQVIVWDITDNYNIKHKINTEYNHGIIFSSLLIFHFNNELDFIITSTSNENIYYEKYACTKIYSLNDGEFIRNIKDSNKFPVYYLLSWYNKKKNKSYLIQFCADNVIINDLLNDEIYAEINVEDNEHRYGIILEKDNTEYLIYSSNWGSFVKYDLYKKSIVKVVNIKRQYTTNFIRWNNNFYIFSDSNDYAFFVFDSRTFKIISEYKSDSETSPCCVNKVYHPKYGECLLVLRKNGFLELWAA